MGERIRQAYEAAGFANQVAFAAAIQKPRQLLNAWVKGRKVPDDGSLEIIAKKTGRTVPWLRYGDEPAAVSHETMLRETGPRYGEGADTGAGGGGTPLLAAELAKIEALELDEWHKTLRIAEVSAAFRAEAMAADARAREADAVAANLRARAIEAAEAAAAARAAAMQSARARGTVGVRGRGARPAKGRAHKAS